ASCAAPTSGARDEPGGHAALSGGTIHRARAAAIGAPPEIRDLWTAAVGKFYESRRIGRRAGGLGLARGSRRRGLTWRWHVLVKPRPADVAQFGHPGRQQRVVVGVGPVLEVGRQVIDRCRVLPEFGEHESAIAALLPRVRQQDDQALL